MKKKLLEAVSIRKFFTQPTKKYILNDISFTVSPGETVAIIGRSGEGKSTLLQILGTLDNPSEGVLFIEEKKVIPQHYHRLRNESIGFIFQSFHLLEDYSVLENVLMPAWIARKDIRDGSSAYKKGRELLEKVGLESKIHSPTKQLSGGEKQRVAIARAFSNDPILLLADEPSGNLDKQTAEGIHQLLISFTKENPNRALITVSHDRELTSQCDTKYELRAGKLIPSVIE